MERINGLRLCPERPEEQCPEEPGEYCTAYSADGKDRLVHRPTHALVGAPYYEGVRRFESINDCPFRQRIIKAVYQKLK